MVLSNACMLDHKFDIVFGFLPKRMLSIKVLQVVCFLGGEAHPNSQAIILNRKVAILILKMDELRISFSRQ